MLLVLNYATPDKVQDITLGIDSGYATIGFADVTAKEELVGGEVEMLKLVETNPPAAAQKIVFDVLPIDESRGFGFNEISR